MTRPVIKGGYTPEWGSIVGGLRTGQFTSVGATTDEIISQLLYVAITGTFTGTVVLERFIGGAWTVVDTYTAPETVIFENPKALRMRLHCTALSGGAVNYAIEDVYVAPTAIQGEPGEDGTNGTNGINGTNGTNGAPGTPGATGPAAFAADAFHVSRAAIAAANVPTIGAGGPKYLLTTAYDATSPMPLTSYQRRSGAPTDTTNPFYVQSTDGQWWEQLVAGGEVFIEQFGGKADYSGSGTGGTDNQPPLLKALALSAGLSTMSGTWIGLAPFKIKFGVGKYKFNNKVMVHTITHIEGTFVGPDASGQGYQTQLHFRNTSGSAFCFFSGNSGPDENDGPVDPSLLMYSAAGSYIGGLSIYGTWQYTDAPLVYPDWSAAIRIRASQVVVDRVGIHAWRSHGIHIHGVVDAGSTTYPFYGNANQCVVLSPWIHSCGGHAVLIGGADANAGVIVNLQTEAGVKGCGLLDGCAYGTAIHGGKIAGYGNLGASKDGKHYQWLGLAGGWPTTTVPGTSESWHYLGEGGPNAAFIDWDDPAADREQLWLIGAPMYINNAFTSVIGMYVELSWIKAYSKSVAMIGGIVDWTRNSANASGNGFEQNFAGMAGPVVDENGERVYVKYGGTLNPNRGDFVGRSMRVWSAGRDKDGDAPFDLGFQGPDLVMTARGGAKELMRYTTPTTSTKFGGQISKPDAVAIAAPYIGDITPGSISFRQRCYSNGTPTEPGEYIRGSKYDYLNPVAGGAEGIVVTTTGAIHQFDWVTTDWGNGWWARNTAGRIYRSENFGTSTIEPTHTSGTQTLADGHTWTWVADGAPVFKTFGSIAA